MVEKEPWLLKLEYWEGCEAVKGSMLDEGVIRFIADELRAFPPFN